jgi:penicillin-binding protein 1C
LLQQRVEALLKREVMALDPEASFAAIVVDNRDRRVLAYVGNGDFGAVARRGRSTWRAPYDPRIGAQAFIYAMGFDR